MMKKTLALYQKYRPITFKEVYGQEQNISILKNSIINNKIQNGYIFCGQYGTGKTSLARIFGGAINCKNFKKNHDVGDGCFACDAIVKGHPDLIEIDAASNSSIDSIRALREEIQISPLEFQRKIYIIDEAHMLSIAAWDGMLKILEDPALKVTFIFATTNVNKIPKTINSRCIELRFNKLGEKNMIAWLENILVLEKIPFKKGALKILILASKGSFRDALTLLDKKILLSGKSELTEEVASRVVGAPSIKRINEWISALLQKKVDDTFNILNAFSKENIDPIAIAELAVFCLTEMMEKKLTGNKVMEYAKLLNIFYTILKEQRFLFNPLISLKVLIIDYFSRNKQTILDISEKGAGPIKGHIDQKLGADYSINVKSNDQKISTQRITQVEDKFETLDNEGDTIFETDELEQTFEISDDTIDIDITEEFDSTFICDEGAKKQEEKGISLELNLKLKKMSEFIWEVIVDKSKTPGILYPEDWNLSTENLIKLLYESFSNDSIEFKNVLSKWDDIDNMLVENKNLPFSALLYDGNLVILTNDIFVLLYDVPIRAALFNRISRTRSFLQFVKDVFGKDYWVIAITKQVFHKIRKEYQAIRQVDSNQFKDLTRPKCPEVIDKIHRPLKKAHMELLEALKNDPFLRGFEIKEKN